jgi:hypothetical protein
MLEKLGSEDNSRYIPKGVPDNDNKRVPELYNSSNDDSEISGKAKSSKLER